MCIRDRVNTLHHSQSFINIKILEPSVLIAYYPVGLALAEQIRSHSSHHGRVYTILTDVYKRQTPNCPGA